MNTRSCFFAAAATLFLSALSGCTESTPPAESPGQRYINLQTGETKDYSDGQAAPADWVECSEASCPAPYPCGEVTTDACSVRADCTVTYSPGCDPSNTSQGCAIAGCAQAEPPSCSPTECPAEIPAIAQLCEDGSTAEVVCARGANGQCGHVFRCAAQCKPSDCPPEMPTIAMICPDGSSAAPVCQANSQGGCGWGFDCSAALQCVPSDCGPIPEIAMLCEDGTVADPVCAVSSDGKCGYSFLCAAQCALSDCGPQPGVPECATPSGSGAVCSRKAAGTCGWHFNCG